MEDLYRPYRPKRRTRATIAKEKGLEPLAALITLQKTKVPIEEAAKSYISEEKEVKTAEEAINGAKDIIAEYISDEADYRIYIRDLTAKQGKITSIAKDAQTESVYEMYYEFDYKTCRTPYSCIESWRKGKDIDCEGGGSGRTNFAISGKESHFFR